MRVALAALRGGISEPVRKEEVRSEKERVRTATICSQLPYAFEGLEESFQRGFHLPKSFHWKAVWKPSQTRQWQAFQPSFH